MRHGRRSVGLLGAVMLAALPGVGALLGSCSPAAPSGGYLCSGDGACPSGLSCVCGLCVRSASDAACGFRVTPARASVEEHEPFSVAIEALDPSGAPATGFGGTVSLRFATESGERWSDVSPSEVMLNRGAATVLVSLNRETVPPQSPALIVETPRARGQSAPVEVTVPPFVSDPAPVIAPLSGGGVCGLDGSCPSGEVCKKAPDSLMRGRCFKPYGWAFGALGPASPLKTDTGIDLYFAGAERIESGTGDAFKAAIGLARSTDGKAFTPEPFPVATPETLVPAEEKAYLSTPSVARLPQGVGLLVSVNTDVNPLQGSGDLWLASAADGRSFGPAQMVVQHGNDYWKDRAAFGSFLVDRDLASSSLGALYRIYFTGIARLQTLGSGGFVTYPVIAMATSVDGVSYRPEPSPVLSGGQGGETLLGAPRVVKDGSVYKMYYVFTREVQPTAKELSLCDLSGPTVGYATSLDGKFWLRSPANAPESAVQTFRRAGTEAWLKSGVTLVVGGLLSDELSGALTAYYSPVFVLDPPSGSAGVIRCVVNGVGRAVRR